MARTQGRATLADRMGTGRAATPAVPAQTSADTDAPTVEPQTSDAPADVVTETPADETPKPDETPAAPVDVADLTAEFDAYRDAADADQAERDDSDPFGAALGHAVLVASAKKTGKRFNVETIPASIRKFVERSCEEYYADEVDGVKLKANTLKYRVVPFATAEDAKKFVEYAKKFGLHREAGKLSVRAYIQEDATKVKVAVSPYATRGPKKATETPATPVEPKPETPAEF